MKITGRQIKDKQIRGRHIIDEIGIYDELNSYSTDDIVLWNGRLWQAVNDVPSTYQGDYSYAPGVSDRWIEYPGAPHDRIIDPDNLEASVNGNTFAVTPLNGTYPIFVIYNDQLQPALRYSNLGLFSEKQITAPSVNFTSTDIIFYAGNNIASISGSSINLTYEISSPAVKTEKVYSDSNLDINSQKIIIGQQYTGTSDKSIILDGDVLATGGISVFSKIIDDSYDDDNDGIISTQSKSFTVKVSSNKQINIEIDKGKYEEIRILNSYTSSPITVNINIFDTLSGNSNIKSYDLDSSNMLIFIYTGSDVNSVIINMIGDV